MIMSVVPERPYSADSTARALKAYKKDIDFFASTIHGEAKVRRASKLIRRGTTLDKSLEGIKSIQERGEGEEDEPASAMKSKDLLSLGLTGSHMGSRITASNMNLMKS